MKIEKYLIPKTIDEAIDYLYQYSGEAKVIAGGTDLMLWLREGKIKAKVLVDITEIDELKRVTFEDDKLIIGAAVTHAEIAANKDIKKYFPSLSDGCRYVGSPQIRNIGTVGGNIVSAQPAADSVIPLIALGAKCQIITQDGIKEVMIEELHEGVGISKIDSTKEILLKIIVEKPQNKYGTAMTRFAAREALALPMANAAVKLEVEEGKIIDAVIAIAPVAKTPFRPKSAERFLIGKDLNSSYIAEEAAELASQEANPRDSLLRGSSKYRKALIKDLVYRAVDDALNRILEDKEVQ